MDTPIVSPTGRGETVKPASNVGLTARLVGALASQDVEEVAARLMTTGVIVPSMTEAPDAETALFEAADGRRVLYAFSSADTFEAWAAQMGDDGHRRRVAGSSLGELALQQQVDVVGLDPGSPHQLGVDPVTLALLLAGDRGTVVPALSALSAASGADTDAVAAALSAVLEWDPVPAAWLCVRSSRGEEVLTVAMAGVGFDGAVRRCRSAADVIPEGLALDVIALDEAQEGWMRQAMPQARLRWPGARA